MDKFFFYSFFSDFFIFLSKNEYNWINCTIFLHNMQNISSTKNIISAQYAQYFFYKKTTLFLHCTPLRPSQCPACPPQKNKRKRKKKRNKTREKEEDQKYNDFKSKGIVGTVFN